MSLYELTLPQVFVRCSKAFLLPCQPVCLNYTNLLLRLTVADAAAFHQVHWTTMCSCIKKKVMLETGESLERAGALPELYLERSKIQLSNIPFYSQPLLTMKGMNCPTRLQWVINSSSALSWGMNTNLAEKYNLGRRSADASSTQKYHPY